MEFGFDVGEQERHHIEFSFDQTWGPLRIKVDGVTVVHRFLLLGIRRTRRYEFPVGNREKHTVLVEMQRQAVLGAFRPWTFRTSVDGQHLRTEQG
jgi:hypothetical protein